MVRLEDRPVPPPRERSPVLRWRRILRRRLPPPAQPSPPPEAVSAEDRALLESFARTPAPGEDGFVIDFLGVRTRVGFLGDGARGFSGAVTGVPIPHDFRAYAAEWLGLIRAVAAARGRFVAMELGAGWGPWLVAGAAAAARRGIREIRLCAVEADPGHVAFLHQHFRDNGLDPAAHRLFAAAVGPAAGEAWWPVAADPANDYGGRVFEANAGVRPGLRRIEMLGLADLLAAEPRWDFVHLDIQGMEAAICAAAAEALAARVARLVIGTHTRRIEGELLELFHHLGWALDHEAPGSFVWRPEAPSVQDMGVLDGLQIWRNPRLAPRR
ncbi:MAG: hypothetical protein ACP5NI_00880 [Acetobacteraceae bacterium]